MKAATEDLTITAQDLREIAESLNRLILQLFLNTKLYEYPNLPTEYKYQYKIEGGFLTLFVPSEFEVCIIHVGNSDLLIVVDFL